MSEVADTRARTEVNRAGETVRHDRPNGDLRARLEEAFLAEYKRAPHRKQLDALEAIANWLIDRRAVDGRTIHRSVSQIVRSSLGEALGWSAQHSAHADRQRYRNNFVNRLEVLRRIGAIESFEPVYRSNGQGTGILIELRRSSSAGRATRSRGSCGALPPSPVRVRRLGATQLCTIQRRS